MNRCSGGGPIPIVRRHAPDRRAKRELGSLLVDLSVEPDGSYYSIYSINNGFRKRSRGISELGCLVSTPWTHKSFIDKRRLISQAGRQRLGRAKRRLTGGQPPNTRGFNQARPADTLIRGPIVRQRSSRGHVPAEECAWSCGWFPQGRPKGLFPQTPIPDQPLLLFVCNNSPGRQTT